MNITSSLYVPVNWIEPDVTCCHWWADDVLLQTFMISVCCKKLEWKIFIAAALSMVI